MKGKTKVSNIPMVPRNNIEHIDILWSIVIVDFEFRQRLCFDLLLQGQLRLFSAIATKKTKHIFYIKTSISWYDWVSLCTSIYWKHVQEIKQQLCRIVRDTPRPRTVDWLHIVSSWRNNFQKRTIEVSYFSLDGAAAAVWSENIRDFISKSLSELVIRL